ncbi:hypothetical protein P7C70_g4312, partial [Phenoliferia sp. Uapishka_3]
MLIILISIAGFFLAAVLVYKDGSASTIGLDKTMSYGQVHTIGTTVASLEALVLAFWDQDNPSDDPSEEEYRLKARDDGSDVQ